MKRYALLYAVTLLLMVPLDFLFLGVLAKGFFQSQVGSVMGNLNVPAAVLFYLVYVAGIVVFASGNAADWRAALLFGALFGFFCYTTFDFTALALLKGWTWKAAAVDISWGTLATGGVSALGFIATKALLR